MNDTSIDDYTRHLNRIAAQILEEECSRLFPRQARWRYYRGTRGERYCWSTETVDGKYQSWVYAPKGEGARSGKPHSWRMTRKAAHSTRKAAKARAVRLLNAAAKVHFAAKDRAEGVEVGPGNVLRPRTDD